MAKRIEFNYYIGMPRAAPAFQWAITREASRIAGGCTVTHSDGYWVEGAEVAQKRYAGVLEKELCFNLQMSVETHRQMEINYTMRACIRQEARRYGLDLNWVHVTTHEVSEHHFQVILGEIRDEDTTRLPHEA